ncbi:hypothetical protein PLESTB_000683800 [Pleodorina starrii]|uniref:Myb-like domain-containing protein n=1 Tax=Pleodorina starrii TaxID=330485 RepID=A0A9W6BJ11_9CHLO|nr:hypothetical protein PLESTB_000683800 [Pleodorina starrii]GLC65181.1 hypothetical protein PLESTF_000260900 [Pleodorina starrii]
MDISPAPSAAVTGDTTGVRTSGRQRKKPTEFWRNEKPQKDATIQVLSFPDPETRRQRSGAGPMSTGAHGKTLPMSPTRGSESRRLLEGLHNFTPLVFGQRGNRDGAPATTIDTGAAAGGSQVADSPAAAARRRRAAAAQLEEPGQDYGGSPPRPRRSQKAHEDASPGKSLAPQVAAGTDPPPVRSSPRVARKAAAPSAENQAPLVPPPAPKNRTDANAASRRGRTSKKQVPEQQPAIEAGAPAAAAAAAAGPARAKTVAAVAAAVSDPAGANGRAAMMPDQANAGGCAAATADEPAQATRRRPRLDPVLCSKILVRGIAPDVDVAACAAARGQDAGGGRLQRSTEGRRGRRAAARGAQQQTPTVDAFAGAATAAGVERQRAAGSGGQRASSEAANDGGVSAEAPVRVGTATATAAPAQKPAKARPAPVEPRPADAAPPPRSGAGEVRRSTGGLRSTEGDAAGTRLAGSSVAARATGGTRQLAVAKEGAKGKARGVGGDGSQAPREQQQPAAQALPGASQPDADADEEEESRPKKRSRKDAAQAKRAAAQAAEQAGPASGAAAAAKLAGPFGPGASVAVEAVAPTFKAATEPTEEPRKATDGATDDAAQEAAAAAVAAKAEARRRKKRDGKLARRKKGSAPAAVDTAAQPQADTMEQELPSHAGDVAAVVAGGGAAGPSQPPAAAAAEDGALEPVLRPPERSLATSLHQLASSERRRNTAAVPTDSKSQRRIEAAGHDGSQRGQAAQLQEQQQRLSGEQAQEPQRQQQQPEASVLGGSQLLGSEGARKGRKKRRRGAAAPSAADGAADCRPGPSVQDGSAAARTEAGGAAAPGAGRSVQTQLGFSGAVMEDVREENALVEAPSGGGTPGAGPGGQGVAPAASGQQQRRQPSAARQPAARTGHTVHGGAASAGGDTAAATSQQGARPATTLAGNAAAPPGDVGIGPKPLSGGDLDTAACPFDAAAGEQRPDERPSGSGRSQAASPEPSGVAARAGPGAIDAMPPRRMELSPSESVAQSNVLGARAAADAAAGAVRGLHQTQWAARRACSHPATAADFGLVIHVGAGGWCGGEARRAAHFRGGGFGGQGGGVATAEPEGYMGAGADVARALRDAAADGGHLGAAAPSWQKRRIPPPPRFDAGAHGGHPNFQDVSEPPTSSHHKATAPHGADIAIGDLGGRGFFVQRNEDRDAQCQAFPNTQAALPSHSGRSAAQEHVFGMAAAARDAAPGAGPPGTSRIEAPASRLPGQGGGTLAGVLDDRDAAAGAAGTNVGSPGGELDGFVVQRSHGRTAQQPQPFPNAFSSAFGGHDGPGQTKQADGRTFAAAGMGRTVSVGAGPPGPGRFEAPATRSAGHGGGSASPTYGFGVAAGAAAFGRNDAGGLQHAAPDLAPVRRPLWSSDGEDDDGEAGRRLRRPQQRLWSGLLHASRSGSRDCLPTRGETPPPHQMPPQRPPAAAAEQRRSGSGLDAVREEEEAASPGLAAGFGGPRQGPRGNGFLRRRDGNVEARPDADEGWRLADGGGDGGGSGQQQQHGGQLFPESLPQAAPPTYQRGRDLDQDAAQGAAAAASFSRVAAAQPGPIIRERPFADVDLARRQQQQQQQHPDGARPVAQERSWQGPDRRGADWQHRSPAALYNNNDRYNGDQGRYDGDDLRDMDRQQQQQRTPAAKYEEHQYGIDQSMCDGSGRHCMDRRQQQRTPTILHDKDQYGRDRGLSDGDGRRDMDRQQQQQQRTPVAVYDNDQYGRDRGLYDGSGGGRRGMDGQQQRNRGTAPDDDQHGGDRGPYAGGSGARRGAPAVPSPPRHATPPGHHQQPAVWQPAAAAAAGARAPPAAAQAFPPGPAHDDAYDRVDAMDVDLSSPDRRLPSDQATPAFASTPPSPQRQQQPDGPLEVLQRLAPRQGAAEGTPGTHARFAAPPAGKQELGQPPFAEREGPWGQRATQAAPHTEREAYEPAPPVQQPEREQPPPPPRFQAQPWQEPRRQPAQSASAVEAPAQGGLHGGQPGAAWADAGSQGRSVQRQPPPPQPPQQQQLPTASNCPPPSQVSGVHKPPGQQPPRQAMFTVPALRSNRLAQQQQPLHFAEQQQQQRLSSADGQTLGYPGQDRQGVPAAPAASATESANPGYESIRRMLNRADAVQKRNKTRSQEFSEREEDGWTIEQHQALQSAFYKTIPSHPNYWAEIARHVPGRTAAECCSRVYHSGKTQDERAMLAKLVRRVPAAAGGPAAGTVKSRPPTVAAARKWSQQEHQREVMERVKRMGGLHAEEEEEQDDDDDVEGGDEGEGPSAGGGAGGRKPAAGGRRRRRQPALPELNPEILSALEDLQKQQQANKWVTSFFSKQGGITKWHKNVQGAMEKRPRGISARAAAGAAAPPPPPQQQPRTGDAARPAAPAAGRRRDDAMARYIRQMLAWDKSKRQQEEWREDDRAEGLVDEDDAAYDDDEDAEGGSEVDEEQERTARDMMQFLVEEGLLGPDGQPVFV